MTASQPNGSFVDREIARNWKFVEKVSACDSTGRRACYFIYVPPHRKGALMRALGGNATIDLAEFGDIIASNYGDGPTSETRELVKNRFGIDI